MKFLAAKNAKLQLLLKWLKKVFGDFPVSIFLLRRYAKY